MDDFSDGFFSLASDKQLENSLKEIDEETIKDFFYPNFSKSLYYQDRYNDEKDFFEFYHSESYSIVIAQIDIILGNLRRWGEEERINSDMKVFDDYYTKLTNPALGLSILFSDGKKILETIALALRNPQIDQDKKKLAFINLVANRQLAKCIEGCYSHLLQIFQELIVYQQSHSQIKQWTCDFVTNTAKKVMLQRPYAVSENYMELISRSLQTSLDNYDSHIMNFFLEEVRLAGYPAFDYQDPIAKNIREKFSSQTGSNPIVEKFLSDFKAEISVKNYMEIIKIQIKNQLEIILLNPSLEFSEKIEAIHATLNRVGLDPFFQYYEILDYEPLSLKNFDNIDITLSQRLIQKNLIKKIEAESITINQRLFKFFLSENNNVCDWIQENKNQAPRFRLLDLLILDGPEEIKIDLQRSLLENILLLKLTRLKNIDLLSDLIVKNKEIIHHSIFMYVANNLLAENPNPRSFIKLIDLLPDDIKKTFVLQIDEKVIINLIRSGMNLANQQKLLPILLQHTLSSRTEALEVTRELLLALKERKKLTHVVFQNIPEINYLSNIDFSYFSLDHIKFFVAIDQCSFLFTELNDLEFNEIVSNSNFFKSSQRQVSYSQVESSSFSLSNFNSVHFSDTITHVSFKEIDLSTTYFTSNKPYQHIDLLGAHLTETIFSQFVINGLTDFSYAYLENINFAILKRYTNIIFIFDGCHLRSANFKDIDLTKMQFFSADLSHSNLLGTKITREAFSPFTHIDNAIIDFPNMQIFYQVGIRNFKESHIYMGPWQQGFIFSHVNLENAEFIGGNHPRIRFKNSILDHVSFSANDEFVTIENLEFIESNVINLKFQRGTFKQIYFENCFNTRNFVLEDVFVDSSLLFRLYQFGLHDFTKVKGIKKQPSNVPFPPIPLKGAKLSKAAFLGLYQAGLRDFRAINLQGFYLGETLLLQKISEIDLKLSETSNKPTYLTCLQVSRTRRSIPFCRIVFLIYNSDPTQFENADFDKNLSHRSGAIVVRKIFLSQDNIWLLNNPNELVLYWRYSMKEEEIPILINFLNKLTKKFQRDSIYLHLNHENFSLKQSLTSQLVSLARDLGFNHGKISFENDLKLKTSMNFQDPLTSKAKLALPIPKVTRPAKKPPLKKIKEKINKLTKLPIRVKNRGGGILRMGIREGGHYQLGEAIIYLIGAAIANKNAEIKQVSEATKVSLKHYAANHVEDLAKQRGASVRQRRLALSIAERCIDRGECYDEETVLQDMADSIRNMRPDLMIGNEKLWGDIKSLFAGIGEFFSKRYQELSQIFQKDSISTENPVSSTTPEPITISSTVYVSDPDYNYMSDQRINHEDPNWFIYPLLTKLIQTVSELFSKLNIDLHHDLNFDESHMIQFFKDFFSFSDSFSNTTLLEKLNSPDFVKKFLIYYSPNSSHFVYLYFSNVSLDDIKTSQTALPDTTVSLSENNSTLGSSINDSTYEDYTYLERNLSFLKIESIMIDSPTLTYLTSTSSIPVSWINLIFKQINFISCQKKSSDLSTEIVLYQSKPKFPIVFWIPVSAYVIRGILDTSYDFVIFKLKKNDSNKINCCIYWLSLTKPICLSMPLIIHSSFSLYSLICPLSNLIFSYSIKLVDCLLLSDRKTSLGEFLQKYNLINWFNFFMPGFCALYLLEDHYTPAFVEKLFLFILVNFFCFSAFKLGQLTANFTLSLFDPNFILNKNSKKSRFKEQPSFFSQTKENLENSSNEYDEKATLLISIR